MEKGLVIKAIAGFFYVKYQNEIKECKSSTKLKKNKQKILPGDNVLFDLKELYIKEILPRTNTLIRPQITNVKNAILVFSVTEPEINYGLLDRMLMIMEFNGLNSTILITKKDLLPLTKYQEIYQKLKYYQEIGYNLIDSFEIEDINDLLKVLSTEDNEKYVLTGQSGVGKSTFLNKIIPDLNIQTQEISKVLGRGKHTTRETTFYQIKNGIYLIDTPGFSSLDISISKEDIRDSFVDFVNLAEFCKFKGCYHLNEPECAIKKEIKENPKMKQRYENYKKIMEKI